MIKHQFVSNVTVTDIEVVDPPAIKLFSNQIFFSRLAYSVSLSDGRIFEGFAYGDDNYWTPDSVILTLDTDDGLITIQGGIA
jgi:hypothetical protein